MIKVHTHPKGQGPLEAHDAWPINGTTDELIEFLQGFPEGTQVTVPHIRKKGPCIRVTIDSVKMRIHERNHPWLRSASQ